MRHTLVALAVIVGLGVGCAPQADAPKAASALERTDKTEPAVETRADNGGAATDAKRDEPVGTSLANKLFGKKPEYREVTVPAGTVLPLRLETSVGSDTSNVEDSVRAHLTRAITINGLTALPENSTVLVTVTAAERPGKVKGRGHIAFRFHTLRSSTSEERYDIRTGAVARTARGTKKKDALKIGVPAAGGAVVGGIVGGKKGAVIGGAAGGGAGTAVVLSTRGEEVRLGKGALVSVKLLQPLTVRVRI